MKPRMLMTHSIYYQHTFQWRASEQRGQGALGLKKTRNICDGGTKIQLTWEMISLQLHQPKALCECVYLDS